MVRCSPVAEPADFDRRVRRPGKAWLRKHPRGRPPALWRHDNARLAEAFEQRCAYTAMFLGAPGTVDHFVSIDEKRGLAYEWSNYRYSAGWVNSRKQSCRSSELLDPFEVGNDWFELLLPSLQLQVSARCPPRYRKRAERTLDLLGLRHDERAIRYRRQWLEEYERGDITLTYLETKAPLVAWAIQKRAAEKRRQRSTRKRSGKTSSAAKNPKRQARRPGTRK